MSSNKTEDADCKVKDPHYKIIEYNHIKLYEAFQSIEEPYSLFIGAKSEASANI